MKIFIDAGHNNMGWDTGLIEDGFREQDITYYISKYLAEQLKELNLQVRLSRPTFLSNLGIDEKSSTNARMIMANKWEADYFISLHLSSGGGSGAQTSYYKEDSIDFAKAVQEGYIKATGLKDRGFLYSSHLDVLKLLDMPGILLEMAVIDNPAELAILKNCQEDIAQCIANSIGQYLGIEMTKEMIIPNQNITSRLKCLAR